MCIYLKNNPAKFHPDPMWNNGDLGFSEESRPNKHNKMSGDMRSVPDLKWTAAATAEVVKVKVKVIV